MNKEAKEKIVQYIKLKDPKGDLVSEIKPNADYTKGKITYNKNNVILHRNISQLKEEEYVRAYLVVKLAKELKYDLEGYEERQKKHVYTANFQDLDKSLLARCSVRYQHPKYEYLDDILRHRKWIKLKSLVNAPIQRGVQPKYKKNSEFYVIKTANLKNDYIELDDTQMVTKEFYEEKNLVAGIEKNDVLIASTGVGSIGKVDLYEFDEPAVADGHISIVRFYEKKTNPKFMAYYLRSILGYLNVERDYVGATNQIEIYPNQLEQIRVIELTKKEQDEIVNKIRHELENLRKKKQKAMDLRNEIDKIILDELR